MIPRAGLLLGLALACAAPAAQATPPDFIQIHDELVAVSADTVFLLRSAMDNLGIYDAEFRSSALIELDRRNGAATAAPLYAARWTVHDPTEDNPAHFATTNAELTGNIDLFARLAEKGALPVLPHVTDEWNGRKDVPTGQVSMDPHGGLTIRLHAGDPITTDIATLKQMAERSLATFAARMDYTRFAPTSLADILSFQPVFPTGCLPQQAFTTRDRTGISPPTLIRLNCGDPERGDSHAISMIVLVPPQSP